MSSRNSQTHSPAMQIRPGPEASSPPPPLQPSYALTWAFSSRTGVLLLSQVVTKMDTAVLDRQMSKLPRAGQEKQRIQPVRSLTRLLLPAS